MSFDSCVDLSSRDKQQEEGRKFKGLSNSQFGTWVLGNRIHGLRIVRSDHSCLFLGVKLLKERLCNVGPTYLNII